MPDVTCGTPCAEQHTYSLGECALSCASIDGGTADKSWTVACPRCKAPANKPCLRLNGTASGTSCAHRWNAYDAQQKTRPSAPARPATTPEEPPVTNETTGPPECPAGVHSLFDPCPGDCGKLLEDTMLPTELPLAAASIKFNDIADTIRRYLPIPSPRSRVFYEPQERTPEEWERRDRYAGVIREEIKGRTVPSLIPGQMPTFGASEYDIADVVLAERDDELAKARAERDAALRIAGVWDDAPDPLARAMAADLRSAIRGAATEPRLLDCGRCYEENGQEVHPHPECATGARPATRCGATSDGAFERHLGPCTHEPDHSNAYHRDAHGTEWRDHDTPDQVRTERDRYAAALDTVRDFNKLVADASCRVQAAEQARDTLNLLDRALNAPEPPPHDEKGQPR
jgi:hypothetical protein